MLCFYDPWAQPTNKNPIRKIEYMIDYIIRKSKQLYISEMELSIDESMIKFKGQNPMTVFVKNKPIQCIYYMVYIMYKVGFRAFVLCESSSGYVLN